MIALINHHVIPAAFDVLPAQMNSPEAHAMLLAIGLQESEFSQRIQRPVGPARGFWQFEPGGIYGVMRHTASAPVLESVAQQLCYRPSLRAMGWLAAIEHNDVLAAIFARLLLYTLPDELPAQDEPEKGWAQYLDAWRPGKPRPAHWPANFSTAWAHVRGDE